MLHHLTTLHQPQTIEEALELLTQPGTYPLYAGGLVRTNAPDVKAAVLLNSCGLTQISANDGRLYVGGAATLESIRTFCLTLSGAAPASLAEILRQELPLGLRNGLALGDILTESRPASPLRTLLVALGDRVILHTHPISAGWLFRMLELRLDQPIDRAAFGFEKVARSPADAPIVCAVVWHENSVERSAVGGLLPDPVIYQPDLPSQYEDYLGSAEYRSAIAPILVKRASDRARSMA